MADEVTIRGLAELNAKFRTFEKSVQKELRVELRRAAEPIAEDIRRTAKRWGAKTVAGIATGTSGGFPVVRQRLGRTTGDRPDFGVLQLREAFIPAVRTGTPLVEDITAALLARLAADFNG